MVLGTKLNQEIIASADFSPSVMSNAEPASNYTTLIAVVQLVFKGGR